MNPFTALKYIPNGKILLDVAFGRAAKLSLPKSKKPVHVRTRLREISKLKKIDEILSLRLDEIVKSFPNFDDIHPFYRTLADTVIPIDNLRQALASVSSAGKIITQIIRDTRRQLSRVDNPTDARRLRQQAYGRVSSVIKRIEPSLDLIQQAALEYRRFPTINLTLPVIVVAGYPNVGKSSLVSLLSTARPIIAEYPFTTKKISVGHFPLEPSVGQVIDVPGLLDRPMSERNPIELRAIAAIRYLADSILFLIDPTLTCGYELSSQVALFNEIKDAFPEHELYPIINKVDIASEVEISKAMELVNKGPLPKISTLTGEGVQEIFNDVLNQSEKIHEKLRTLQNPRP